MTAMTIVHLDMSQKPLAIFLVVVTNPIAIESLNTIIIMAHIFYHYNIIYIIKYLYILLSY
jgi:hypothetical protein